MRVACPGEEPADARRKEARAPTATPRAPRAAACTSAAGSRPAACSRAGRRLELAQQRSTPRLRHTRASADHDEQQPLAMRRRERSTRPAGRGPGALRAGPRPKPTNARREEDAEAPGGRGSRRPSAVTADSTIDPTPHPGELASPRRPRRLSLWPRSRASRHRRPGAQHVAALPVRGSVCRRGCATTAEMPTSETTAVKKKMRRATRARRSSPATGPPPRR